MHRFLSDETKRSVWLEQFQMNEADVKSHKWSIYFPDGDASKSPNMCLEKRFSSPIKKGPRAKRAKQREEYRQSLASSFAMSATPTSSLAQQHPLLTNAVGEQLESDYSVHELPSECTPSTLSATDTPTSQQADPLIHASLVARIEYLEAKIECSEKDKKTSFMYFRTEQIPHNDDQVLFYTDFISFALFLSFYEFLGVAVNQLNYWGST